MNSRHRPLDGFSVIGHRGAMGYAPENTLAAFAKAIELQAHMSELDIHQSRDGELIVIHDAKVDRTTNGSGAVSDLSLAEIKRLDAGTWFAPAYAGEQVPTLQEVMDFVKGKMALNVEVKAGYHGAYPGIIDRLIEHISRNGLVDSLVVSSFNREYLLELRRKAPSVRAALLYSRPFPEPWQDAVDQGWDLHPNAGAIDAELMDEAHSRGVEVRAWTPNEPDTMRSLIALGVDAIITNYPDRLQEVLRESGLSRKDETQC
ncbi:MAG: glycerophosphodiester phosphodiesterase [Limnochordia bacterium]|jgi:glycerophosphoryl diester phosphodiesterase